MSLGFPDNNQAFAPGYQGINFNSPTVNYMLNGGMGNIPPSPIGAIVGLGTNGYNQQMSMYGGMYQPQSFGYGINGGYYTNAYNQVLNPYLYQQQIKAQEAAARERQRLQTGMMKTLSKRIHECLGDTDQLGDMDDYLKQYDPPEEKCDSEYLETYQKMSKIQTLQPIQPNYGYIAYCNKIHESYSSRFPDNMSLAEFLDKAGELYREALIEENKRRQQNGKLKYDSGKYKELVALHKNTSSYFNSALTGRYNGLQSIDVGDMEIQLPQSPGDKQRIVVSSPSYLETYAQRRQEFLKQIIG